MNQQLQTSKLTIFLTVIVCLIETCQLVTPTDAVPSRAELLQPLIGTWMNVSADSARGVAIDTAGTIAPLAVRLSTGEVVYDVVNWSATITTITPDSIVLEYYPAAGVPIPHQYRMAYHLDSGALSISPKRFPPLLTYYRTVTLGERVTPPIEATLSCTIHEWRWNPGDTTRSQSTSLFRSDSIAPTVSAFATWSSPASLTITGQRNHRAIFTPYTETVTLTLSGVDSVGTYQIGPDTTANGAYSFCYQDVLGGGSTQQDSGWGQVTLTAFDRESGRCAGTFQFTTAQFMGWPTYEVEKGVFDVPFRREP